MKVKNSIAISVIAIVAIAAAIIAGHSLTSLEDNDAAMVESMRTGQQQMSESAKSAQKSVTAPIKNTADFEKVLDLESSDEENLISAGDSEEALEPGFLDEFGQSYMENEF